MGPQIACMRRCIVTLVAFGWFYSTASHFLQEFYTCLFTNKSNYFPLFNCYCVLCFAPMVASNWEKVMIDSCKYKFCPGMLSLFSCTSGSTLYISVGRWVGRWASKLASLIITERQGPNKGWSDAQICMNFRKTSEVAGNDKWAKKHGKWHRP